MRVTGDMAEVMAWMGAFLAFTFLAYEVYDAFARILVVGY